MLDTVDFNHVQHISFTQSRLTDAVSVILSELLSYEHPPNVRGLVLAFCARSAYRHIVIGAAAAVNPDIVVIRVVVYGEARGGQL